MKPIRRPRGIQAGAAVTFLEAGQHGRFVTGFHVDDATGGKAGLRQCGYEEVLPCDTPKDAALGSCGYSCRPERCRRPINRRVGPARDLMRGAESETPSRKHVVDLGYAERKDLAPAH